MIISFHCTCGVHDNAPLMSHALWCDVMAMWMVGCLPHISDEDRQEFMQFSQTYIVPVISQIED